MTRVFITFVLGLLLSTQAIAEQALSKPLAEAALAVSQQAEELFGQHPEWEDGLDKDMDMLANPSGFEKEITQLKKVGAYKPLTKIAKDNGFASLSAWYNVFRRTMLSAMSVQTERMGIDFESGVAMMEAQVAQLREQGIPEDILKEQQLGVENARQTLNAIKTVSTVDKQFAKDNIEWLMEKAKIFDEEPAF